MKTLARRLVVLLALGVATSGVARAQAPSKTAGAPAAATPSAALPSAERILNHYYEAIGGRSAWEKLHSRVSKGTIEIATMNNLSGTIEVRMKAPNSTLVVIHLGGAVIRQGFDGATAWSDDPRNGLRVLTGAELEDERRESNFYHALDLQKIYSKMTATGTEKVGDLDTYVIEAVPLSGGDADRLYFDTQSGLLVHSVNHRHTPDGTLQFEVNIKDYRDVDGIKLPFSVEQISAQSAFTIKFSEIEQNVDLADSEFAEPAAEPAPPPSGK